MADHDGPRRSTCRDGALDRSSLSGHRGLGEIAREKTAADPDRVIVREGARALTRGELFDGACRLGAALAARGIAPGAALAFQLPNWWEACVINLAAALFGYRLVPLLTIYRQAELGFILPACDVAAIFVPQAWRGFDYPGLVARVPGAPRHVFTLRGDASAPNSFETLLAHAPATPTPPPAGDAKMVLFTSGSTGRPKGVIHSHATADALIRRTAEFWRTGQGDGLYIPSPIGHIGGSIYAFEFPWITDCTAILAETWDADAAVRAIDEIGATFMAGATPFLAGLLSAAQRAGTRLPSLRRYICGGASVPPELVLRGLEHFPNAVVSRAYGSTEVPLVCPGARDRTEAERRADTDGEISVELRIVDDAGQPVAEGEAGEILVRGPQMLLGYLDPADDASAFTEDGFFRMGDLGRRGRALSRNHRRRRTSSSARARTSARWRSRTRWPGTRGAASSVVGVPDRERADGGGLRAARRGRFRLRRHEGASGGHRPRAPEIPRAPPRRLLAAVNSIGKVQKNELKALAAEGTRA